MKFPLNKKKTLQSSTVFLDSQLLKKGGECCILSRITKVNDTVGRR